MDINITANSLEEFQELEDISNSFSDYLKEKMYAIDKIGKPRIKIDISNAEYSSIFLPNGCTQIHVAHNKDGIAIGRVFSYYDYDIICCVKFDEDFSNVDTDIAYRFCVEAKRIKELKGELK